MKKLIPLNVCSYYDFLNSTISLEKYISFLIKNNIKVASLISKESVFGIFEFLKLTKKENIKPIIGTTFSNLIIKYRKIELTCIVKGNEGYKNLNFLSSIVMDITKSGINLEILKKKFKDLIFIISLNKNINLNNFYELKDEFSFISNDLYWGCNEQTDVDFFKKILKKEKIIEFKSVRVLDESDKQFCKILRKIKVKKNEIKEEKIFSFFEVFSKYDETENFFLIKNQEKLISEINFEFSPIKKIRLNNVLLSKDKRTFKTLSDVCFEKLSFLKLNSNKIYIERLEKELRIIKKKDFFNYFLIVKEYVDFAKKEEILVGPGRGSAPGSLVCFLLGITTIDPIKYNLFFERFLNYQRKDLPDIDVDFEDLRRIEVIEHITKLYGPKKVCLISTFQKIKIKSAIKDIGKVLNIEISEILEINKSLKKFNDDNLEDILKKSIELRNKKEKYPDLFKYVEKIIGFPRQFGIHSAGLIISDVDLDSLIGVWRKEKNLIIQIDMKFIEDFGLIKMDILGLKNLTLISNILSRMNILKNKNDFLYNLPLKDKNTFELLSKGNTKGIFQLETIGMTILIKKIMPKELEDIITTISLYRPGTKKYIEVFLKRKKQQKKYKNTIPEFNSILIKTQGIPIFQEQIIEMIKIFLNISIEKADILRRLISKKDKKLLESFKEFFFIESKKNNYSNNKIEEFWIMIKEFTEYGFNRSHAVGYSFITYWMSFLKTKYFNLFFIELLNDVIGDNEKTIDYLNVFKLKDIEIMMPNINKNILKYDFNKNCIFLPLIIIKGITNLFLVNLKKEIEENGIFKDIYLFLIRMNCLGLTEEIYKKLVYSGSLDCFNFTRESLIQNYWILSIYIKTIKIKNINKFDLSIIDKPKLIFFKNDKKNIMEKQKEVINLNL